MKFLYNLKNIFCGEKNIHTNITIFSILGIFAILMSSIGGVMLSGGYFGFSYLELKEIKIITLISLLIFIFFNGYIFDYSNSLFNDENAKLPEVTFKSFITFFKMLPLFVTWFCYVTLLFIVGEYIFKILNFWAYTYYSLVCLLMPFITIIFVIYSKNFKFNTSIYNPLPAFKIIYVSSVPLLKLLVKLLLVAAVIGFILFKCFSYTDILANTPYVQISLRILLLAFSTYILAMLSIIYANSLVRIIKDKSLNY